MRFWLPHLYPILDSSVIPTTGREAYLEQLGRSLAEAGVRLLEYRNKRGTDSEVLADARVLRSVLPALQVRLILDDRVDVALAANFDGVHVDAGDIPAADARLLLGAERIVGTSATNELLLLEAVRLPVDYVSFGPVFETTTKQTSVPPIGVAGVKRFREAVGPEPVLVAAAGISLDTAAEILEAGADAVAVSAAIFRSANPAEEVQRWMQLLG